MKFENLSETRKTIILGLIFFPILVAYVLLGNEIGYLLATLVFIWVPFACACLYYFIIFLPKCRISDASFRTCRYEDDGILYIDQLTPYLSTILAFKEHGTDSYKYNQEKIHFGSVTVGGVTSGGVYKTGGNYSKTTSSTGRYKLIYKIYDKKWYVYELEVKKIILSDDLVKEAKKSYLKKYLTNNEIVILEDVPIPEKVKDLMLLGYTTEAVNLMNEVEATGYPDKEKATVISSFLCRR